MIQNRTLSRVAQLGVGSAVFVLAASLALAQQGDTDIPCCATVSCQVDPETVVTITKCTPEPCAPPEECVRVTSCDPEPFVFVDCADIVGP